MHHADADLHRHKVESQQKEPVRERQRDDWQRLEVEHERKRVARAVKGLISQQKKGESQRREAGLQQREVEGCGRG